MEEEHVNMKTRYEKPLKPRNLFCFIFLKFVCNFNEAMLSSSMVQTFLKFWGINIWSSTIMWGLPPMLIIFLGPYFRK